MCTVSFVPTSKGIIITSNRDEKVLRKPASMPQKFVHEHSQLFYPVDGKASGTWFLVRNDNSVGVLLNGAFEPHIVKENYRISRGSILPEIFLHHNPLQALQEFDLNNIENFTILIFYEHFLHECKWNGVKLYVTALNIEQAHIYSSVTLYNTEMIRTRERWFDEWLNENQSPLQVDAINFHATAGKDNKHFGLQMNRNNEMKTVSITSVLLEKNKASLCYQDCIQQQSSKTIIELSNQLIPYLP